MISCAWNPNIHSTKNSKTEIHQQTLVHEVQWRYICQILAIINNLQIVVPSWRLYRESFVQTTIWFFSDCVEERFFERSLFRIKCCSMQICMWKWMTVIWDYWRSAEVLPFNHTFVFDATSKSVRSEKSCRTTYYVGDDFNHSENSLGPAEGQGQG